MILRPSLRQRLLASAAVVGALSGASAAAQAPRAPKPIVPGATPLVVAGAAVTASRCPSTTELDGTSLARLARAQLRSKTWDPFQPGPVEMASVLPLPAVTLCDPEAIDSLRPLGAFGGATTHELGADNALPGLRALGAVAGATEESVLEPGDRVTLPEAGPASILDLFVATTGGARLVRIAPLGTPRAVAVRIEGTRAAAAVVVERASGEPSRVAVAARPAAPSRVRATMRGRSVEFSGRATPGTFVTVSYADAVGDTIVVGQSGRFSGLNAAGVPRRTFRVGLELLDLARRDRSQWTCVTAWSTARRANGPVRCRPGTGTLSPASIRSAATRHAAAVDPVSITHPDAAHDATPFTVAQADVTEVWRSRGPSTQPLVMGDLNGDGQPEFALEPLGTGKPAELLLSTPAGSPPRRLSLRRDEPGALLSPDTPFWVPDVDGDGRDDLRSDGGVVVTDAFPQVTSAFSSVDLRAQRRHSTRDFDFGPTPILRGTSTPAGSVRDVTGDGRTEPMVASTGAITVYPSEAVRPGLRSRLAESLPLALADDATLGDYERVYAALSGRFGREGHLAAEAEFDPGTVVVAGTVATLLPSPAGLRPGAENTFVIRVVDGRGDARPPIAFTNPGPAKLIDHDPVSGDSLVALFEARRCPARTPCTDRLVRIAADGRFETSVAFRRDRAFLFDGRFVTDGPDADGDVDIAFWVNGGSIWADDTVKTAGRRGTVNVLVSTRTGEVDRVSVPVFGTGSTPIHSMDQVRAVVLPDGSRRLTVNALADGRTNVMRTLLLAQRR